MTTVQSELYVTKESDIIIDGAPSMMKSEWMNCTGFRSPAATAAA